MIFQVASGPTTLGVKTGDTKTWLSSGSVQIGSPSLSLSTGKSNTFKGSVLHSDSTWSDHPSPSSSKSIQLDSPSLSVSKG